MTPRLYVYEGKAYLIREARDGERFVTCEYGVLTDTGVQWRTCRQGVDFAEIEPFWHVEGAAA